MVDETGRGTFLELFPFGRPVGLLGVIMAH